MKKLIFLFCSLLLAAAVFAHNEKLSLNSLEKTLNAKGVAVYLKDGKPFSGTTYDEYGFNQIYREAIIYKGLIQKQYGWYFTGEKESEFSYQNGALHGKAIIYHRNGNIYLEEYYRNGVTEGKQYRYNCDGSMQSQWDSIGNITLMKLEFEKKKCTANCIFLDGC